jgi:hypothetical protein
MPAETRLNCGTRDAPREAERLQKNRRGTFAYRPCSVVVWEAGVRDQKQPLAVKRAAVVASGDPTIVPVEVGVLGVKPEPGAEVAD